ncbi:MAG: hypothetical protein ABIL09_22730 [Gemmatimonadota bacterium]
MRGARVLLALAALPAWGAGLAGDPDGPLSLSGYYENQLTAQRIAGRTVLQDSDRLRLDLAVQADARVTFAGDLVWRLYHGVRRISAFDLIPPAVVGGFAAEAGASVDQLRPGFEIPFEDEHFVDNAFASLCLGRLLLRVGKQQLAWGTGYTWNPTDLFQDKDILDPTYEKTGVGALRAEIGLGPEGRLVGLLTPGPDWQGTGRALRAAGHLGRFDVSASAVQRREDRAAYLTGTAGDERRRLAGADFAGQVLGLGVWGEGAYSWMSASRDFGQYLLGADHTSEGGTYLIGEYYRNGRGRRGAAAYTFADWMRLLGSRGQNLGRDYAFLGVSRPARDLWTLSAYVVANLSDRSLLLLPWLEYSLGDNSELDAVGYLPAGGGRTEFGHFGAGGLARLRVYF